MTLRRVWVWSMVFVCLLIAASAVSAQDTGYTNVGLAWPSPPLANPIKVRVEPQTADPVQVIVIAPNQDAVIIMPREPVTQALAIRGGRNVVLIGGEISIPWQGEGASISQRTGLKIVESTGTVHIEGLAISGDDLTEGIQISAPNATVQLQNVGIYNVHARDQVNFSDNHPDLIQPYGGVGELRISGFTGSTDYQGFFLAGDVPYRGIHLSRVNIHGLPTARYLMWFSTDAAAGSVHLQDVWLDVPAQREGGLGKSVWPDVQGDYPAQAQLGDVIGIPAVFWPAEMQPSIQGIIFEGVPPGGDYVRRELIGLNYMPLATQ